MPRTVSALAALLPTSTAVAACGGSSPTHTTASTASHRTEALKLAECMRTHGVPNFPDPKVTSGPGGHGIAVQIGGPGAEPGSGRLKTRSPAFTSAQKVCQKHMAVGPKAQGVGK